MSDFNFDDFDLGSMSNEAAFGFDPAILEGLNLGGLEGMDFSDFDLGSLSNEAAFGFDPAILEGVNLGGLEGMDFSDFDLGSLSDEAAYGFDPSILTDGDPRVDVNAPLLTPDGIDESPISGDDAKVGSGGYYDEITGEFIYDENGGLRGPLDETSGTNSGSMDGYTYDKKSGTWTTPAGETYTPKTPPSHTSKSGAQVMVDAGALPSGYAGLTPTKGSTADIKGDGKDSTGGKDGKSSSGDKTKTGENSLGSLLPLLLALLAMNKGGGKGGSQSTVIPGLTATQKQTPYTQQQQAPGYRPGQGGISYFAPTQYTPKMASGGIARLLDGPGDGVSDSIPAVIDGGMAGGGQPAKVARGEYIIDARTVAALGNGSTDAGAERLDKMRQNILRDDRKAGVGKDSKAYRHLMA
jgi:hypothetical protein